MADTDETAHAGTNGTRRAAASSRARQARTAAQEENLENQIAQLQADIKAISDTLSKLGHSAGDELRSNANARVEDLTARGRAALNTAQKDVTALEKQITDTIREKPLTAVAGAVAIGFLLAVLTR